MIEIIAIITLDCIKTRLLQYKAIYVGHMSRRLN